MEKLGRFFGAFFGAFLCIVLLMGIYSIAEDITLTTYYPAPYGAYDELTTTGNTYLATTSGNVGIGTTTPGTYKLKVIGTIDATTYSAGTTPGAAGTTTITYVKTVNFMTQTVTTGTITVKDGIVTTIN